MPRTTIPLGVAALCVLVVVAGCASGTSVRTSADTAIVTARAAPVCGGEGAERIAQKQAAIETLRSGYDRYIIYDAANANNVTVTSGPGTYQTTGTLNNGFLNTTTTYQPGPPIVSGNHQQSFAIKMFKEGQPGAEMALSAREALGPEWQTLMNQKTVTCSQ